MGNFIVSLTRGKNFGLSYQEVGITEGLRNQDSAVIEVLHGSHVAWQEQ